MISGYIDTLNKGLNRWKQIKKFAIVDRELSIEAGDLTPSMKLRRKIVVAELHGRHRRPLRLIFDEGSRRASRQSRLGRSGSCHTDPVSTPQRRHSPDSLSQTHSSGRTMPSRMRPVHGSGFPMAGPMVCSCRMCRAITPAPKNKFMPAPGYSSYVAPEKYAQLGRILFGGHEPEESRQRLFQAVEDLLDRLKMPRSLREIGISEDEFLKALPQLAMTAFQDLSNRTNPRMPLVSEITTLLRLGYYGDGDHAH